MNSGRAAEAIVSMVLPYTRSGVALQASWTLPLCVHVAAIGLPRPFLVSADLNHGRRWARVS